MKKNVVKLNENTLRKIVAESVKKALDEALPTNPNGSYRIEVEGDNGSSFVEVPNSVSPNERMLQILQNAIRYGNRIRKIEVMM